jgi:tryptophan-rich sensory protein
MDWIVLLKTFALCLMSIIIEGFSATKGGRRWFENLIQPRVAFPLYVWYIIGVIYYILCGIIAYRLFHRSGASFTPEIILLTVIMIINALTNFILFNYRSLKWFYVVLYPFTGLFTAFILVLLRSDPVSAALAGVYACWLVYDLYYFRRLWKLNIPDAN